MPERMVAAAASADNVLHVEVVATLDYPRLGLHLAHADSTQQADTIAGLALGLETLEPVDRAHQLAYMAEAIERDVLPTRITIDMLQQLLWHLQNPTGETP